jgi:hypothetical protein
MLFKYLTNSSKKIQTHFSNTSKKKVVCQDVASCVWLQEGQENPSQLDQGHTAPTSERQLPDDRGTFSPLF